MVGLRLSSLNYRFFVMQFPRIQRQKRAMLCVFKRKLFLCKRLKTDEHMLGTLCNWQASRVYFNAINRNVLH
ncbi:hypothetical protein DAPPUDRAFT_236786 [Daphnia pulex]|uniref:Uncharacterized protein n=1 Tax=Daphnia pulex TaxID=6669 RepID=E9G330_DAPPU|nr:hypothetical protein DAPPUDRAFT_236786 [Daphnia pulex]|eukprot:EFX86401.1 hypothetical protein DAPPUDRAFT_236786 [Daphnia pulex]